MGQTAISSHGIGVTCVIPRARKRNLHSYTNVCIFMQARLCQPGAALYVARKREMKYQRHNAIRELVAHSLVANQDELRRKLRRRGFEVTQATLSRDIHELRLSKGPGGYALPNGNGNGSFPAPVEDDAPPSVAEVIESF